MTLTPSEWDKGFVEGMDFMVPSVEQLTKEVHALSEKVSTLTRERDQAREALEPFAKAAALYDSTFDDDDGAHEHTNKVGELRRARSVLHPEKEEKA